MYRQVFKKVVQQGWSERTTEIAVQKVGVKLLSFSSFMMPG